jgi:hypothetical protein
MEAASSSETMATVLEIDYGCLLPYPYLITVHDLFAMSVHAKILRFYGIRRLSLYSQKPAIGRRTDQYDAVRICTSDFPDIRFNIVSSTPTSLRQSLAF